MPRARPEETAAGLAVAWAIAGATGKLRGLELERRDDDRFAVGEQFSEYLGCNSSSTCVALAAAAAAHVGDDNQIGVDQIHHAVAERAHPFLQAFAGE